MLNHHRKSTNFKFVSKNELIKRLKCCTKDYFNETSLHGFHYITDKKSSRFKSFFWTVICTISTILCVRLIYFQYTYYASNRISTTISTTAFPIWNVPFPAVTICNFNVVYKDSVKQFKKLLENDFSDESINNFFSNLSDLIPTTANDEVTLETFPKITRFLEKSGYSTEELMSKLAQPCEKLLSDCYWNMKEVNCGQLFVKMKTNDGFCCSFNYKGVIDEDDLAKQDSVFVQGVGPAFGLSVTLNVQLDQYFSTIKQSQGVEVAIHESIQYPDMSIYSATVYPGQDVSLSVKPEITESTELTRDVDMKTRGCAFHDEIPMAWSDSYSYSTCISQCKANTIMKLCGCIPFYYPMIRDNVRVCSLLDIVCFRKNSAKFKRNNLITSLFDKYIDRDDDSQVFGSASSCKCMPPCNEVTYSYQMDQQGLVSTESNANLSSLQVYFSHVSCTKISRTVFMTWESVLAAIGGLIGLCLGGSILTVIEFFYHVIDALFTKRNKLVHSEPPMYPKDLKVTRNPTIYWKKSYN